MSVIRRDIKDDVDGIVQNAQQLADWKHYVRAFPLSSLAVAAVTGYVAVPRRLEVVSPDADQIAKLARQNRLVVSNSPASEARSGVASTVAKLVASAVLRAAIGYATMKVGSIIGQQAVDEEATT
ncbi:MAG: hypothetical protein HQ518_07365 [Rhodopirellula sp.]|nr:hypothetical protein [Rhodopirellula sp.]